MDRELAGAVFARWRDGEPVHESALYKAAAFMGMDPSLALMEARYFTVLDNYLLEKRATGRPMLPLERAILSAAAGAPQGALEKLASRHGLDQDEVILRHLQGRSFEPDIEKLAFLGMEGGPSEGPSMDREGQMGGIQPAMQSQTPQPPQPKLDEQAGAMMQSPPQPGAQVQQMGQDPRQAAMEAPSPTAPPQIPPSAEGNLDELLQQAQQAQHAEMGGGLPPGGMGAQEPPPPPPSPEERIQQMMPQLPGEAVQRYAQKLQELEQTVGIPVTDPKQINKFIQQQQKADGKVIDGAIKQMADQQTMQAEQQVAQMGARFGGGQMGQPGGAGGAAAAGGGGMGAMAPQPKMQPPEQAAVQKVAAAARAMARAHLRG